MTESVPPLKAQAAYMGAYLLRRLLFIVPTLLGIAINFLIIQAAPGGPSSRQSPKCRGSTRMQPNASAALE